MFSPNVLEQMMSVIVMPTYLCDRGQPTSDTLNILGEGYHADHGTNTFLPTSHAIGSFDYVNSGVYLHDGDDDCAPMHVIPGSHRQAAEVLLKFGSGITDRREVPAFAQPVPASAKAGSVLFYSSYLIHAANPFENKRKQRAFWTLSMARGDTSRWTKLANPWSGPEQQFFQPFWEKTTPRVRSLFGWVLEPMEEEAHVLVHH